MTAYPEPRLPAYRLKDEHVGYKNPRDMNFLDADRGCEDLQSLQGYCNGDACEVSICVLDPDSPSAVLSFRDCGVEHRSSPMKLEQRKAPPVRPVDALYNTKAQPFGGLSDDQKYLLQYPVRITPSIQIHQIKAQLLPIREF